MEGRKIDRGMITKNLAILGVETRGVEVLLIHNRVKMKEELVMIISGLGHIVQKFLGVMRT